MTDAERAAAAIKVGRALIGIIEDKDRAVEDFLRKVNGTAAALGGGDHAEAIEETMTRSLEVTNASRVLLTMLEDDA